MVLPYNVAMEGQFDFIVVGAGSAGCVLAARLTEHAEHRVLLVEAGGADSSPWIHVPVGYAKLMGDARVNWLYRTAPEPSLGGRELDQPCGRVLGGTGAINGMLHVRGQPEDYDGWRALGNDGWGWDDVRPWLDRLALPVADPPHRHPLADAFVEAAVQAGHPRNEGFNGPTQEGAGYYKLNTRGGRRATSAIAYLRPARGRANLAVATRALVTRLLLEGGEARGIEYRQGGRLLRARARREVVVAAGTFNSPLLLQLSGIGPGALLQRLGIAVVRDLPGVGENLQNHYRASIVARCARPITLNDDMRSLWRRAAMGLRYLLFRDGPLAAGTYAGGFFRTPGGGARPDVQVTFWTYSVAARVPGFTANAVLLRPRSRGWVRAASADPGAAPQILYNALQEAADGRTMVAGMRLVREVFAQPALAPFHAGEIAPGPGCDSDQALLAYAREKGNTVYHPVGTCAMGSVVDRQLRVIGVGRLRIADASVMPAIPSGNTNAPTAMIAERAADWMLKATG
jgi:choline dehydrogenase